MTRHLLLATCALSLSACTIRPGEPWNMVRKDEAIWDRVIRQPYDTLDRLQLTCLRSHAIFTHDQRACFIQGKRVCYYMTMPNDSAHDPELTAFCNGYRPT